VQKGQEGKQRTRNKRQTELFRSEEARSRDVKATGGWKSMNTQGKEPETPGVTAEKGHCQHKHKFSLRHITGEGREEGTQESSRVVKETCGKTQETKRIPGQ